MSVPTNGKDRSVRCKTCLGILIVKDGSNSFPVCFGIHGDKEIKLSELRNASNKLHAYQYENPTASEKQVTSVYFGDSFWSAIARKTPQGVQKNIIVNPTAAVVMRMFRDDSVVTKPNLKPRPVENQPTSTSSTDQQMAKGTSNTTDVSNLVISKVLLTLQKNVDTCHRVLTPEKYSAFFNKFCATTSALGTNLTTNFIPRFTDAGTKVVAASVKVGYNTYDMLYSILTK